MLPNDDADAEVTLANVLLLLLEIATCAVLWLTAVWLVTLWLAHLPPF